MNGSNLKKNKMLKMRLKSKALLCQRHKSCPLEALKSPSYANVFVVKVVIILLFG